MEDCASVRAVRLAMNREEWEGFEEEIRMARAREWLSNFRAGIWIGGED